ncbi:MAG: M48 family metalloprotease [Candidatus Dormibacteria bacterium]
MKRRILVGLVGVIVLSCLFGRGAPCGNGFACLAANATHPLDVVFVAGLVLAAGFLVVARTGWTALRLSQSLRQLPRAQRRLDLEQLGVECITSVSPVAFCAGALRPRVYVTDALVDLLNPSALAAVIAHERAHAQHHDPLRRSMLAALSALSLDAPWVLWLRNRHGERAELAADRAAATQVGARAVADALTTLAMGGDDVSGEEAVSDSTSRPSSRPIVVSALATLVVAVTLPCALQAALLLGSGHIPPL